MPGSGRERVGLNRTMELPPNPLLRVYAGLRVSSLEGCRGAWKVAGGGTDEKGSVITVKA